MSERKANLRLDDTGFGNIKIWQDEDEFCYGIDAVLLADFTAVHMNKSSNSVLDLGCGTGIIPLLLSHKTAADEISGLEVQKNSYELALKNIEENKLSNRIKIFCGNVKDFQIDKAYQVVTCNPPYFQRGRCLESDNLPMAIARHEIQGSLEDFFSCAKKCLKDKGELFMIHRPDRLVDLLNLGREYGLEPRLLRFVSNKVMGKPKMVLCKFVKGGGQNLNVLEPLTVHDDDGSYNREILNIYER